jgi:cupin superfamily acireductone dioxygenase involved in methionine salvage
MTCGNQGAQKKASLQIQKNDLIIAANGISAWTDLPRTPRMCSVYGILIVAIEWDIME